MKHPQVWSGENKRVEFDPGRGIMVFKNIVMIMV